MTFTNTQIRTAIIRAADHIEANPDSYDFNSIAVPSCGTPGCMWGWIGHFLGLPAGESNIQVAKACLKNTLNLYLFCDGMIETHGFKQDPRSAASLLRAYADANFPAPNNLDPAFLRFRESLTGVVCG